MYRGLLKQGTRQVGMKLDSGSNCLLLNAALSRELRIVQIRTRFADQSSPESDAPWSFWRLCVPKKGADRVKEHSGKT